MKKEAKIKKRIQAEKTELLTDEQQKAIQSMLKHLGVNSIVHLPAKIKKKVLEKLGFKGE